MKLLTAIAFAAAMILVALGIRAGQIDPNAGAWLIFTLPAIAAALLLGNRGGARSGEGCC